MPALNIIPARTIVYPKDIQNITGRSDRTARRLLSKIRSAFGKLNNELISVQEFCAYTGLEEELVREFLR